MQAFSSVNSLIFKPCSYKNAYFQKNNFNNVYHLIVLSNNALACVQTLLRRARAETVYDSALALIHSGK